MADKAEIDPADRLDDLIGSLNRAEAGGLKLDTLMAYAVAGSDLRTATLRDIMTEGSFSLEVAGELLDGHPPPFTRTLDAAIPGENIVLATYSDKRGQWAAVQRDADGREFMSWAATEALARRAAALQAFSERAAKPTEDVFAPIASLAAEKPAPELKAVEPEATQPQTSEAQTFEPTAVEPKSDEPVVEKIMRDARPDAPEWRIKF